MEHLLVKAEMVATEEEQAAAGSFVALASTYEIDRTGDRVVPGAFRASLRRWRRSGKQIPVLADHHGKIESVVGRVDPRLSFETDEGLEVSGVLDTSTEIGERTYALLKAGVLSWSIGYKVPKGGSRRRGGVTELIEIDLAEISAVPTPAAEGTRTLSIKSATEETWTTGLDERRVYVEGRGILSRNELREYMDDEERKAKLAAEVKAVAARLEAEEKAAEAAEKAAAAFPPIPTTDRPFEDDEGRHLAGCAAPGCHALATNADGSLRMVPDRRWFCDRHRHLAGPEDHLPEPRTYILSSAGGLRLNPESAEGKRVRAEFERQQEEKRKREEHEQREAEALRKVREKYAREATVVINGRRVHPANVRFT